MGMGMGGEVERSEISFPKRRNESIIGGMWTSASCPRLMVHLTYEEWSEMERLGVRHVFMGSFGEWWLGGLSLTIGEYGSGAILLPHPPQRAVLG
jgi:hypothetical protein